MLIISPTGKGVRGEDGFGSGEFGAIRSKTVKDRKTGKPKQVIYNHKGVDWISDPGQLIYSPIDGIVERIAKPRAGKYSGLYIIKPKVIGIKLFYFKPYSYLIDRSVFQGEIIGVDQNIAEYYDKPKKKMINHIHLQVEWINPEAIWLKGEPVCCEEVGCKSCH